jgi:hypothetical protein
VPQSDEAVVEAQLPAGLAKNQWTHAMNADMKGPALFTMTNLRAAPVLQAEVSPRSSRVFGGCGRVSAVAATFWNRVAWGLVAPPDSKPSRGRRRRSPTKD